MRESYEQAIKALIEQATKSHDSGDAMRFSQAVYNLTNALHAYVEVRGPQPQS